MTLPFDLNSTASSANLLAQMGANRPTGGNGSARSVDGGAERPLPNLLSPADGGALRQPAALTPADSPGPGYGDSGPAYGAASVQRGQRAVRRLQNIARLAGSSS